MKIIGISGKAGAGKDTAYALLKSKLESEGFKVTKLSFASKLKDACALMFGWDRERLETDFEYKEGNTTDGVPDPACIEFGLTRRQIMQIVGTECFRDGLNKDTWIKLLKLDIEAGKYDEYDYGFVPDCRFLNEIQFVRDLGGDNIIVVKETGVTSGSAEHQSESEFMSFRDWDVILDNPYDPSIDDETNLANFLAEINNKWDQ